MKDFMFLTKEFDNFVIFYFNGYLNKSLKESEIRDRMDLIFKKGCNRFIMNFGDTNLINSVGVSILMGIVDSIIKNKRRLAFSNLSKTNFEIFDRLEYIILPYRKISFLIVLLLIIIININNEDFT